MKRPIFIISILILVLYPVWSWYTKRMLDGSDEPWGVLALATLVFFIYKNRQDKLVLNSEINLLVPALILVVYSLVYKLTTPLPRGILAMTALTFLISRYYFNRTCHLGVLGLAMLSLPIIASLQFYLGYPLRVFVADLTVPLLRITGCGVVRQGASLVFGRQVISIDAPCSGIKMLWAGGYLVCVLCILWNVNNKKTLISGLVGIGVIVVGNVLRSASLFYLEVNPIELPTWGHSTIGLIAFSLTSLVIIIMMQRLISIKGRLA